MWHISINAPSPDDAERLAFRHLRGVGDASLGEWQQAIPHDDGRAVFHLRRRLSAAESAKVGPIRDVRGTPEQGRRAARISQITGYIGHLLEY